MKKSLVIFFALASFAARAALPQPDLIARIHFLGADQISTSPNATAFTNEFSSPEARALENQTLDKLARAPGVWFKSKMAANAKDGSAQLRPLLDDLLKSEWIFEARDRANGSPEYALAIRLSSDRAQIWSKNLAAVLQNWTGIGIATDKSGNWQLRKHDTPNLIQFSQKNDWTIIDCGENQLSLGDQMPGSFVKTKITSPETNWLTVDLNWPRLSQWFPKLKEFNLPETQFAISAPDNNFRINGNFFFPQNLSATLDPWRMPTNAIHEPFVSFTAARGFAAWLGAQMWMRPYEISPAVNQIFIWALPQIPFQTFAAIPVPNSTNALSQVYSRLESAFNSANSRNDFLMPIKLSQTNEQITLVGAPFIAPYVRVLNEPAGEFLLAGFFPNPGKSKPLPPELFSRLAQKNLVYYHWEITAERLPQLLNLTQLGLVLTQHKQLDSKSVAFKWEQKIGPTLGNTVTEIFENAPDQFSFTRKAPGGFTALELLALANWLEATNFPGCDLKLPPRATKFKTPKHVLKNSPAAPTPH